MQQASETDAVGRLGPAAIQAAAKVATTNTNPTSEG
jgi:hypothetical protein